MKASMNFYKMSTKKFSSSFLKKEFKLSSKEIRELNNEIKKPWVKPGWDKPIGLWLLASAGVTLGMVLLGGYVRLNKAGLSMVKWDLSRFSVPKSEEAWEKEFTEYKEHPQHKNDFPDMTIEGFKTIYLMEHYHRLLGKYMGLSFIIPSVIFTVAGVFNSKMVLRAGLISALIGAQGLIGIWMVRSGLKHNLGQNPKKNDVKVSHYRLATHFTIGVSLYWLIMNSALFMLQKPTSLKINFLFFESSAVIRKNLFLTMGLILSTFVFGSLMAGQNAGKIANTFPKMGDIWYPGKEHYDPKMSKFRNNVENSFLIHFNHRLLGTVTLTTILFQTLKIMGLGNIPKGAMRGFSIVAFCALIQYYLGMLNVVLSVPPKLAHLHQFMGTILFTSCIVALSLCRKVRPEEMKILMKKLFEKDSVKLQDYMLHFKSLHPEVYGKHIQPEIIQLYPQLQKKELLL